MASKSFAFTLYFDAALENQVLKLWNILARRQISSLLIEQGTRPHICLCITTAADEVELSKLRTTLESFAAQERPVSVTFSALGGFCLDDNLLFLAPAPTIQLLAFHDRFHEVLQVMGVESSSQLHQPGNWFPHCALAQLPSHRYGDAFSMIQELQLPLTGHICDVGMVQLEPFKEYFSYSLEGVPA